MQYVVYGRISQLVQSGKALHKPQVIIDYRGYLGLLQHDLANPDAVGIDLLLPGQIVTAVLLLPCDKLLSEPVQCLRTRPKNSGLLG